MNRLRTTIRDLLDRFRIRPAVHGRLMYWTYGPEFRRWCRSNPCEILAERTDLYRFLLEHEGLDGPIDYIEFGVSQGSSMRWWVENNRHPDSAFVGFDSFEGLPEGWDVWPKGAFSTQGRIPEIFDSRCSFVKGLFQDTLPGWLADREFARRTVIHLDADLYTSTLMVLTQLLHRLKYNDIVVFDEFDSYLHEYRAFIDAATAYRRDFVALCRNGQWARIAMKVS